MKKYVLPVLILTLIVSFLLSQHAAETKSEERDVLISRPLAARAAAAGLSQEVRGFRGSTQKAPEELANVPVRQIGATSDIARAVSPRSHVADAALAQFGGTPMPQPAVSVPGLSNIDNAQVHSLLIIPPDMNGDVGPDHYFQVVNSLLRVFNKNGQPMSQPFKISSLFESLGTVCSTRNDGLATV